MWYFFKMFFVAKVYIHISLVVAPTSREPTVKVLLEGIGSVDMSGYTSKLARGGQV